MVKFDPGLRMEEFLFLVLLLWIVLAVVKWMMEHHPQITRIIG